MASTLPQTMRASQWTTTSGGLDKNLRVNTSAPLPTNAKSLKPGETCVKVAYTTVNPADYKAVETLPFLFSKPATPCMDYSGTVVTTTLPHLKPGELVFGKTEPPVFGCLGEYVVVGKAGCVPVPDSVRLKDAACVGVTGLTSYQCLAPYVKAGDKVFINGGSGGTGTFGIQIAKAMGCHVTATCSGPNVDLCKSLGADEVIDYRSTNVVSHLQRSGTQYDLVVDNVFSDASLYWACHNFLKPSGKYVTVVGTPSLAWLRDILSVFLWPSWLGGGQRKLVFTFCTTNAVEYEKIAKWMQEGKVKAVIDKEYNLEQAGEAFAHLKTGHARGKVLIEVSGE
ncbi:hypothetical protein BAUCODRAFT_428085 [Baudoinia panamericana UAMH 10762]|uniref:Enoyl reductase (ER) domain-containing protein n=1 Tax=Baudoinia panamericana (strain UAMH 10762) TaxID=717646 RepID=M2N3G5_BAUPA|nr:uncharacterized protein BAUCODRAFT_428085 [Baudoinia panamericana UAMH 10762]EMC98493.1 hypothetical protein BAUCODRAFT_428085 [Baudoinia panamericana UAMH 10762]